VLNGCPLELYSVILTALPIVCPIAAAMDRAFSWAAFMASSLARFLCSLNLAAILGLEN
jgi:hypothetical protein